MAKRGYRFEHQLKGNRTQLLDVRDMDEGNDGLAELATIHHARKLKASGVSAGEVVVTGYGGAEGFTYSVPVTKADKIKHDLEKLSDKPYPGFDPVCNVIDALWPDEGPRPLDDTSLTFYVWDAQVEVTIMRPRGAAVDMVYAGQKLMFHLIALQSFLWWQRGRSRPNKPKRFGKKFASQWLTWVNNI